MKKLPIGIQDFGEIRARNYYYVDKTYFVWKLTEEGKYYFLSRPRRFGKSLFVSTLKHAFEGKKELFEGLFLYDKWDWSQKYPVILIDFSAQKVKTPEELESFIMNRLMEIASYYRESITSKTYYEAFYELIKKLSKHNKVVVLIDEYDKPVLDNIENQELARECREVLKGFYQVIKPADPYLKFVFLTGVSKFSKMSIFSGLNNLNDITLNIKYAEICGYTQSELENVFSDRILDLKKEFGEKILEDIKFWYNGYSWGGEPLYNPFDILLFFENKRFKAFWFETGTPEFLIKLIREKRYYVPDLERLKVGEEILEAFDVGTIKLEALLFQTGYLTIKEIERFNFGMQIYTLGYPNFEVKVALNSHILNELIRSDEKIYETKQVLRELIERNDFEGMRELFYSFFASIPYDWYRKNQLSGYEGYYASVFYAYFVSSGFDVRVEDTTSKGKIDMTVLYKDRAYIFEFKVVDIEGGSVVLRGKRKVKGKKGKGLKKRSDALLQIKEKRYWEKYSGSKEIYIVGVEFESASRNIVGFEWERIK